MSIITLCKKFTHYRSNKFYKKYNKLAVKFINKLNYENLPAENSNKIFFCWFQGIDKAPEIVKICYNSLKRYNSDKEVIVITENNYSNYVEFPKFIIDKYNAGIINKTHFSDLLRMELLIKYGGCWADATALFTSKIPDSIFDSEFFAFREIKEHTEETLFISSWFISACSNNKMLRLERELIYYYWSKNNKLNSYYLFHKLFVGVVIKQYKELWDEVLLLPNSAPKALDCVLFKRYNCDQYQLISDMSFIHKLMYKYPREKFELDNTFYSKLKRDYLE